MNYTYAISSSHKILAQRYQFIISKKKNYLLFKRRDIRAKFESYLRRRGGGVGWKLPNHRLGLAGFGHPARFVRKSKIREQD
jgi:hypothetical protein